MISSLPNFFHDRDHAKKFFKESIKKNIFSQVMANFLMASLEKKSQGSLKFLFDQKGVLNILKNTRENDYPFFIKQLKTPVLILRGEQSKHFSIADFNKTLQISPLIIGKEYPTADTGFMQNNQNMLSIL